MEDRLNKTLSLTIQCKNLLIVFILVDTILSLPLIISNLLLGGTNSTPGNWFNLTILLIFLIPFIKAGLYGLAFLNINSKIIGFNRFFYLAINNFIVFFYISLVISLIHFIYGFVFPKLVPYLSSTINNFNVINIISNSFFSLIVSIFFVFSYPLAIVGFFANHKLMPVRSSFKRVLSDFSKLKFIIVFLIIKATFSTLSNMAIMSSDSSAYLKILLPVLTTPITFIVLIYSYLLITECFYYKDLNYNFEIKT